MTQDKWLPHICQVSESKCETHTIPFSPKLSLHSPSFPHICSTVMTSVMPCDTLYKLQLSSHLLTCQTAVSGVQNPKAEGKVQSYKSVLSKAPSSALSPWIKARYIQGGFIPGTQLMDYHQQCTLSVHLHTSHRDVGSQEIHFQLYTSIFPSATSTDVKNPLAQG